MSLLKAYIMRKRMQFLSNLWIYLQLGRCQFMPFMEEFMREPLWSILLIFYSLYHWDRVKEAHLIFETDQPAQFPIRSTVWDWMPLRAYFGIIPRSGFIIHFLNCLKSFHSRMVLASLFKYKTFRNTLSLLATPQSEAFGV